MNVIPRILFCLALALGLLAHSSARAQTATALQLGASRGPTPWQRCVRLRSNPCDTSGSMNKATGAFTKTIAAAIMHTVPSLGGAAIQQTIDNTKLPYATDFSGVDPTGTTDSTNGLQSAINAVCANTTGRLFIPAGSYKYTALNLNCSDLDVQGAGLATVLRRTSTSGNAVTMGVAGTQTSNIRLHDLSLVGDLVTVTGGAHLYVVDVNNGSIDHVQIYYGSDCLQLENSSSTNTFLYAFYASHSNISSCRNDGILVGTLSTLAASPADVFFDHIQVNGNNLCGWQLFGVSGIHFSHTDAVSNGITACHQTGANQFLWGLSYTDVEFDTPTLGANFFVDLNPSAHAGAWVCVNCWISNALRAANVSIGTGSPVDGLTFLGGNIIGASHGGLENFSTAVRNLNISGMLICNNGTAAANSYHGVYMVAGSQQFDISHNTFGDCGPTRSTWSSYTNNQDYSVFLDGPGSNNYVVSFNRTNNAGHATHLILDASNGNSSRIFGNLPVVAPTR